MKTIIFETETEAALYAADIAAGVLNAKSDAVFCLAAGHSSLPFFDAVIAKNLDFSRARFVELDEWMDLPREAQGSCAGFLIKNFFSRINAKEENICLFDPLAEDGDSECLRVTDIIAEWGGIDYMLLGMGQNGHLGLNEPPCDLDSPAHIEPISLTTLNVAPKYFGGNMPNITRGITLGLSDTKKAKLIHLLVLGSHKKEINKRLRECTKPDPDMPASALLGLEHAQLIMDSAAAG